MSAYQDASLEYNQLNIKICDFFPLGAFGCFLTPDLVWHAWNSSKHSAAN
jgi:hypothetical protein